MKYSTKLQTVFSLAVYTLRYTFPRFDEIIVWIDKVAGTLNFFPSEVRFPRGLIIGGSNMDARGKRHNVFYSQKVST